MWVGIQNNSSSYFSAFWQHSIFIFAEPIFFFVDKPLFQPNSIRTVTVFKSASKINKWKCDEIVLQKFCRVPMRFVLVSTFELLQEPIRFGLACQASIVELPFTIFGARFTKQGKLALKRNSIKVLMEGENSAGDLLTMCTLEHRCIWPAQSTKSSANYRLL